MPKLLRYLCGMALVLGALEGAFRLRERELAACGDRILTKAAVLDRQGPVEVLFFGTSRSWDAISPRLFTEELEHLRPGLTLRGFNLAVTSATLETLESLAGRFARRPGLRLAVIELSGPQLELARPAADEEKSAITAFAERHLRLIRYRSALRGESLERLPELLFYPRRMDGSEILLVDQLRAAASIREARAEPVDLAPLRPAPLPAGAPSADPRAARLLAVGRLLRASLPVVFVVPPIQGGEPAMRPYAAALAVEFPVWDFGAAPLPPSAFRDTTHLDRAGRALFSRMLAAELARADLLPSPVSRRE